MPQPPCPVFSIYPGANYVIRPDGKRKKITPDLKEEIINFHETYN
jgi:hypothetical protein